MECGILFYSARKTALCEKALKKCLFSLKLSFGASCFAADARTLGVQLSNAFSRSDAVFVIGGLNFSDSRNAAEIISSAVDEGEADLVRRLKNSNGADGYLLRAGGQLLVMLPDEPAAIEGILRGTAAQYISAMTK